MVTRDVVLDILKTIDDPEMPISIVDLGMVECIHLAPPGVSVAVDLLPTFVGCPALPMLEQMIADKVGDIEGVEEVAVNFVFDPPWTVDRISESGRRQLKEIGVGVPSQSAACQSDLLQINLPVPCPFCDSTQTRMTSPFGPTRCRKIYYCESCKNPFEQLKRL